MTPLPHPSTHHTHSFAPTRWTIVLAAADPHSNPNSRQALSELAQLYWFPLYAYIRRQGRSSTEAEDLTQDFFAHLLDKKSLTAVDPAKGKFRSFLLASLKNFLLNDHDKSHAQKRGGGGGNLKLLALNSLDAESRYALEPADHMTPERLFEQRWAWTVLDQVLIHLKNQYLANNNGPLFEALKHTLTGQSTAASYADIAATLNMKQPTLIVAAHRLRRRYRELLREEIAQTVPDPSLIDDEITYLLNCL